MTFAFGDHILDPDRRELFRGLEPIAIGPQVFDLLAYLLRNRQHVVTKDDLIDAVWNGRIISESTLTSHINAVRKAIGDSGGEQRLIRTIARKGYRFVGDVREMPAAPAETAGADAAQAREPEPSQELHGQSLSVPSSVQAPTLPDRPSIAVLPFLNLSADPSQDYFVDGVVEDIIAALSRMSSLFVIARNSSFTYKGRTVDAKEIGRELGVRYIVEGSLRKAASRVRITGQLVDAITGINLWSERFEGNIDDIFDLQDQLTMNIVGSIAPQVERAEIERARNKPTDSLDAYDYHLRAMAHLHHGTREAIDAALPLFYTAIDLDPGYAPAYAMAGWCYLWRMVNRWLDDPQAEMAEGARLVRRGVELGRADAVVLARGGHAIAHLTGDIDAGIALLDRAKLLNPNLAAAWFLGGFLRNWRGESDAAVTYFAQAMRLSPLDPEMYRMQAGIAAAHLFAGRFDEASSWAELAFRELPSFLMVVVISVASHALAGRIEEARRALQQLRQLDPAFRLSHLPGWMPILRPQDIAILTEGLRKAGLPA